MTKRPSSLSSVTRSLGRGRPVVVVPSPEARIEPHLVLAAAEATAASIHFLARNGSGILSVALPPERLVQLQIPRIVGRSPASVALRRGSGPDGSARGRAETVRALADPDVRGDAFDSPGHVFPVATRTEHSLEPWGCAETALALVRQAGLPSAAVLTPLLTDDGSVPELDEASCFARAHGLEAIPVDYIGSVERSFEAPELRSAEACLPTRWGHFQAQVFEDPLTGRHDMALILGELRGAEPVLTRLHSECLTGDVLGSLRCDCGPQLHTALQRITEHGRGVLLYLRQEGRGIGLYNKLRAYALQEQGFDTVEANEHLGFPPDARDYRIAARILEQLGVSRVELLTNNPRKLQALDLHGIEVVKRHALEISSNVQNAYYLQTKRDKLGHLLEAEDLETKETA